MNNFFSNGMTNMISFFKRLRLERVLIAVFAGFFLFISTACSADAKVSSAGSSGLSPSLSGTGSYESGRKNPTELYDTIQPKEGGMNVFSDTDPRQDTKGLGSAIDNRVRDAERNIDKVQNPREFAEDYREGTPLGQRVKNITDSVGNSAKGLVEDLSEGAEKGSRNLKVNADRAGQGVKDTVGQAGQNAKETGADVSRKVQRFGEGATGTGEFSGDRAKNPAEAIRNNRA